MMIDSNTLSKKLGYNTLPPLRSLIKRKLKSGVLTTDDVKTEIQVGDVGAPARVYMISPRGVVKICFLSQKAEGLSTLIKLIFNKEATS